MLLISVFTGSPIFKVGLELSMQLRLASSAHPPSSALLQRLLCLLCGQRGWNRVCRHSSLSQQGWGRKLCEENSECLWEHSKNTRQETCDFSFLKAENYSWNEGSGSSQMYWVGMSLLQNIHYCLLLFFNSIFKLSCIWPYGKHYFVTCSLSLWLYTVWTHGNPIQLTFLNPQSIHYLKLWIKLVISWDCSLSRLSVIFSQVPLP